MEKASRLNNFYYNKNLKKFAKEKGKRRCTKGRAKRHKVDEDVKTKGEMKNKK